MKPSVAVMSSVGASHVSFVTLLAHEFLRTFRRRCREIGRVSGLVGSADCPDSSVLFLEFAYELDRYEHFPLFFKGGKLPSIAANIIILANHILGAVCAYSSSANQVADDLDRCTTARARNATQILRAGDAHFRMSDREARFAVTPGSELSFLEHQLPIVGVLGG
jgi:hypothetical protein